MQKLNNYIDHITFVIDASGSMQGREKDVVKVFDGQIAYLARRSKEIDHEIRVTVYFFDSVQSGGYASLQAPRITNAVYDKDVLRLPSLADLYKPFGGTPLRDATIKAIGELKQTATLYGDHSFLTYVITDGAENTSKSTNQQVLEMINGLPEEWTVAVLVPDQLAAREAKQAGFPAGNVQIWSTQNANGMEEVGKTIEAATERYLQNRSVGIRGSKNLFAIDTSQVTTSAVKANLQELKAGQDYEMIPVRKDAVIKDYVESWTSQPYRPGSTYYELTKKEKIQGNKRLAVMEKRTGKVYTGEDARAMVKLPNHEVRVAPVELKDHTLFVQSNAANRKLIGGTRILVMK